MSRARNVVWSEGLFLTPHLFQQADRYRDNILHSRLKSLAQFYWGLSEFEIDREGLASGFLFIVSVQRRYARWFDVADS